MHREQPHFDRCPDEEKSQGDQDHIGMVERREQFAQVGHVQGTRHDVQVSHPQEVETGAYGAHDDVIERRQGSPVFSDGDQGIGGEGSYFQEDIEVESIPGHEDAHQPGEKKKVNGVKPDFLIRDFLFHAGPGRDRDEET